MFLADSGNNKMEEEHEAIEVLLTKGGNAFDFSDNNAVKCLMGGS